jgi:hypothetical protein
MVGRLLFAALGGPVVALLLFAAAWLFERILSVAIWIEGWGGTFVSFVAVWGLLGGIVYVVLYGVSARTP